MLFNLKSNKGFYGQFRRDWHGFTLIEIVIVIAIIATLSAIAIPAYTRYMDKSDNDKAIEDILLLNF